MNNSLPSLDGKLDAIFAHARTVGPETSRAEYAFETRLLARLAEQSPRAEKTGPAWGYLSWRLLPIFAAFVLALGVWDFRLGTDSQDAAQTASLQNPEAVDLFATFQ